MNPELDQLRQILNDYKKAITDVSVVDDPEYIAWISDNMSKEEWPEGGDFAKARTNVQFRKFRAVYIKARAAMDNFKWDIMPRSRRNEYQDKWKEETGVPF